MSRFKERIQFIMGGKEVSTAGHQAIEEKVQSKGQKKKKKKAGVP